ncbi:uncharacterized protein [Argopecten irradians]|uniref:uncharacterized protein n=1 Tax=Argopecten irradians TaxID=31199 RepID=UPI003713C09F
MILKTKKMKCVMAFGCLILMLLSIPRISKRQKAKNDHPNITLFTAWSTFPERYEVFNNTLRNWPLLQPHVKLYLFTNDFIPGQVEYEKLGWTILPIYRTIKGCGVLKDLYLRVMQLEPESKVYAMVNGDILLTGNFLKNLHDITSSPLLKDKTYFLTGRKLNITNVTREEASSWENIERASKRGVLVNEMWGIDYYITPPSYHWHLYPDFQLWRSFYDNWMIWDARRMGYIVIDATQTLLAPHQNAPYPKNRGNVFNNLNYMKVNRSILYTKGTIPCCEYHTVLENGMVTLKRRDTIPDRCNLLN